MIDTRPGARLLHYTVLQELGRGGMGVVLRARDERNGREVALKVVLPELVDEGTYLARFRREARAAATVRHPNVVALRAYDEVPGLSLLAFELVPGGSLKKVLERAGGTMPWQDVARYGADIAEGLVAIHGAGLVHRDLKPDNVLLDADGTAKISDLGLVRGESVLSKADSLTQEGQLVGTVPYMAPEQVDEAKKVGPAADLYALGATLYHLLVGRPPFSGSTYEIVKRILVDEPPRVRELVPDVPPALERVVHRLLAKRPEQRGTTDEAARDLLAIAEGRSVASRSKGVALALGGAALVVGIAAVAASSRPPAPPSVPPRPPIAPPPPPKAPPPAPPAPPPVPQPAPPPPPATHPEDDPVAPRERAREIFVRANALIDTDPARAIEIAKSAIEADPTFGPAWTARGQARAVLGDLRGAVEDLTRAIELDPGEYDAWRMRGTARIDLGDLDGERDLDKALELDPGDAAGWAQKGDVRAKANDYDGALVAYERALKVDPRLTSLRLNRAAVFRMRSDWERTKEECDRALDVDPRLPKALRYRAEARERLGDRAGAKEDRMAFIAAAKRDPEESKLIPDVERDLAR